MRRGTPQELTDADPVVVELAHGSVELKQVVSEKHALGLIHDIESMELAKRIPSETSETVSEILKVLMSGGHNGFQMFPKEFGIT